MIKRLVVLLVGGMLSACGSIGALGESPSSVLAAAAQKADVLQSYSVQFDATESYPLPAGALGFLGGVSGASGATGSRGPTTIQIAFKGAVRAVKPDRIALDATAKFNSFSLDFSTVTIGADAYTKDLFTNRWKKTTKTAGASGATGPTGSGPSDPSKSINDLDPATFTDLVKYLTVQETLADTDVNGAHVHHYKVKIDAAKLKAELSRRGVLKDSAGTKAFDDFVQHAGYKMEIWIGTSDHLVRRVVIDVDTVTDAGTLGGFSIGGTTPKSATPTASPQPVHVTGRAQLDYSDFNKPLTINPPPTG